MICKEIQCYQSAVVLWSLHHEPLSALCRTIAAEPRHIVRFTGAKLLPHPRCSMHPLIESSRSQIIALCRLHRVRRLEVFGSALRDDFDIQHSDVDVVVEFEPLPQGDGLRRYFDFKTQLEALLRRPVDLVELAAMENTRLKRIIERTKVPVYAAA